jgi:hypothetical protein
MFKIVLYITGFVLIVGTGMWFELHSGDYVRIEQQIAKKK